MSGLDHALLYEARKLLNGANVHSLSTAIVIYETSMPGSARRAIYEAGLRQLVYEHRRISSLLLHAQAACQDAENACNRNNALSKKVAVTPRAV